MMNSIFKLLQDSSRRLFFCSLVFSFCVSPVFAQDEDEEEEMTTGIKQPVRRAVGVNYPTVALKGLVTDIATGKPLSGVQLQALGNKRYTAMTEEDGTFVIKVPTFTTALYVHAPAFMSQQVAIIAGDSTQFVAVQMLKDAFQPMYGTGTDYIAKGEAQIRRFGLTVDNEISSKLAAEMHTVMRSGTLDGGAVMFIRGLNSITSEAQPLVVIDGIEQDMQHDRSTLHDGFSFNMLANISPDDVEKVTVLKNATALYGARGANGVVLIETKRGHSMATRIDANISAGITLIPRLPTMMNATQYRNYATEMVGTLDGIQNEQIDLRFLNDDPNGFYYHTYHNNTDWKDEVYRNAMTNNYSINVQGGDDIGMYNLSVGYVDAKYAAKGNEFNRMNVRFNTDINILYNLKTIFDISIARTHNAMFDNGFRENLNSGAIVSPIALALIKSPLVAPYQYNKLANGGKGGFTSLLSSNDDLFSQLPLGNRYSLANPLSVLEYGAGDNKNVQDNTYFNVRVEPVYTITPDLSLTAMASYTLNRNAQRYFRPLTGVPSFMIDEMGSVYAMAMSMFAKQENIVGKLQFDWSRQYGAHTFGAFVGVRYNTFSYDNSDLSVQSTSKATSDKNPSLAWDGYKGIYGTNDTWKQIQWYANVDYNYMHRYFATLSFLGEANSRFGENADALKMFGVRWALFPSLQFGWVLTNEAWFPKNRGVNYLRLNAGYDISGNDGISNYAARTSYSTVRFNDRAVGVQLTNIGNDKVQWEKTQKFNLGMQAYFVDNRIGLKFDYFLHKTDNLLTLKNFSTPIAGINRYWSNGGKLENQGFELMLTGKPVVKKDWNVEVGVSVGHYVNKVTQLPDGDFTSSVYGDDNILTSVGNPVALFYGYKTAGVFSCDKDARAAGKNGYLVMKDASGNSHEFKAGDMHFVDMNNDGVIDEHDKTIIGNPNPDIYGNIFTTVNWKDFTLGIGINYSLGNDVFNYQRSILNSGSTFYNQQVTEVGRWRYEGQVTNVPRAEFGDPMGNNRFSDRWIEDGSYLRLTTVNLTYRVPIPNSWTSWVQGLSIWAEAQNLFTLTKYLGSDPEFSAGNSVYYQGIDNGNIAHSRSFTMGLRINL